MPYLMGVEKIQQTEAENNINDGAYIINIDENQIIEKSLSSITLNSTGRFKS